MQERGSYLFELNQFDEASVADLLIDDVPLEALRVTKPETALWRWSPGFHAGTVEAELRLPGAGKRYFEIVTDPDLRKLTRSDFDGMVKEILQDTFALFALSGFRIGVGRGAGGRPPPIARLEFLRSRVHELEEATWDVARNPRRMLRAEEAMVPYHRAVRATGPEILRSFQSGRVRPESGSSGRLPAALRGVLPKKIRLRRRRSSLDLPEHRQMAACLRSWQAWLNATASLLDRTAGSDDPEAKQAGIAWADRCRRLARRLGQLSDLAPFAEAPDAEPRLLLSSVFRNVPPYRRFYQLWQDMNVGIAAVFGAFLEMPLARTFELYELWCFLRLLRAAAEVYGGDGLDVSNLFVREAGGGVTVAAGAVTVPVGSGWKLCFQRTYREFWLEAGGRGSFSRIMKPDLVMRRELEGQLESSERLIVLDAKYRIEDGLTEALNSIHTYRDALVHEAEVGGVEGSVTAAYLLAPHVPEMDTSSGYQGVAMPARLFHPEYRRRFRFGIVSLRPGMQAAELRDVLKTIVADAMA